VELLILRHAKAVPQGFENLPDEERPLAPEGTAHAESLGRRLLELHALPQRIYSSPLARARDTVQSFLRGARRSIEAEFPAVLRPGCTSKEIQEFLGWRASRSERLMIVGHQPDLGQIIGALIGGDRLAIHLPPGVLARVDLERPEVVWTGYLVWLWTAEMYGT